VETIDLERYVKDCSLLHHHGILTFLSTLELGEYHCPEQVNRSTRRGENAGLREAGYSAVVQGYEGAYGGSQRYILTCFFNVVS